MPIPGDFSEIERILDEVLVPRFVKVRQLFHAPKIEKVDAAVFEGLNKEKIKRLLHPGMKVAVAVGSRGITNIAQITKTTLEFLTTQGVEPFIIPAMGSHGGATAEGQKEVLETLGITEESMGVPILSSMGVEQVGEANGLPVFVDKHVLAADGVIIINRIKPHTAFRGVIESGIVKMSVIGLGKQKGADSCHQLGMNHFDQKLIPASKITFEKANLLFGIAILENAYDQTSEIHAVPVDEILEVEPKLLEKAKERMPRILFNPLDVLVVDEIGKDISGDGMDPNVTGRFSTTFAKGELITERIVVLGLTEKTEGNGNGVAPADITTMRLYNSFNMAKTYINALTAAFPPTVRIPMVMRSDDYAIRCAIKTSYCLQPEKLRIVRIKNTLHLEEIYISEGLLAEAMANPQIEILGEPEPFQYDEFGNLLTNY
ncbi:lactate racemase domain-containing protein [Desulfotomaculum sp. 1211_IL3151]|uniref:lactate racemase domain-containing protein n=1 Tax=Desulfotomaculum sp. 1211_IL3151 TaxID=3084055 RepID=UPI002FDA14F4